jgi:hypothetical protein
MTFRLTLSAVATTVLGLTLGCGATPNRPTPLPLMQPFELRIGAAANLENDVTMTFQDVNADSRCPMDAICVWAGEAVITVVLTQPSAVVSTSISGLSVSASASVVGGAAPPGTCLGSAGRFECALATTSSRSTASQGSYSIRLVQVAPYPHSASPIRREDYVATLVVAPR